MDRLEAFMIIYPWHMPIATLILGFLAGLLGRPWIDKLLAFEKRLMDRILRLKNKPDMDEHTLVTGEDA